MDVKPEILTAFEINERAEFGGRDSTWEHSTSSDGLSPREQHARWKGLLRAREKDPVTIEPAQRL